MNYRLPLLALVALLFSLVPSRAALPPDGQYTGLMRVFLGFETGLPFGSKQTVKATVSGNAITIYTAPRFDDTLSGTRSIYHGTIEDITGVVKLTAPNHAVPPEPTEQTGIAKMTAAKRFRITINVYEDPEDDTEVSDARVIFEFWPDRSAPAAPPVTP